MASATAAVYTRFLGFELFDLLSSAALFFSLLWASSTAAASCFFLNASSYADLDVHTYRCND
jgi:hypothetical protein